MWFLVFSFSIYFVYVCSNLAADVIWRSMKPLLESFASSNTVFGASELRKKVELEKSEVPKKLSLGRHENDRISEACVTHLLMLCNDDNSYIRYE